jgi:hypothetical protein
MDSPRNFHAWQYLMGIVLGFLAVFFLSSGVEQTVQGELVAEAETIVTPPPISGAIDARAALLSRTIAVSFVANDATVGKMSIALSAHPEWVAFALSDDGLPTAVVHAERVKDYFNSHPMADLKKAHTCTIVSRWTDEYKVTRAETDCIASAGYDYDIDTIAHSIATALNGDETSLTVALNFRAPEVYDPENSERPLVLLATGRSEFSHSPDGRIGNVKKGLDERLQNVWVPEGATFSFNPILGDMGAHTGWYMAPTIFEGGTVRSAPGGGICQVSTTLYRAVLRAGLPVVQQKNHSLYVFHYEEYGAGLDATVYTDKQDFKFTNDTGGPLLIQTRHEGTEAYVNIYGYDDGRRVTMEGPFFLKTDGAEALGDGTDLKINEIGWRRTISKNDTTVTENRIARYNAIPKTLAERMSHTIEIVKEGAL